MEEVNTKHHIIIDVIRSLHPHVNTLLTMGGIVFGGVITRTIDGFGKNHRKQNLKSTIEDLKQYVLDYLCSNEHDIDIAFYSDKIDHYGEAYNMVAEIFGVENIETRNGDYDMGEFARYICYAFCSNELKTPIRFDITFIDKVEKTYNFNPRFSIENLYIEEVLGIGKLHLFYEHPNCKSVDEAFEHVAEKILIIVEPPKSENEYTCSPVKFIWRVAKKYFSGLLKLSEDFYTKRVIAERIQSCLSQNWYNFNVKPYSSEVSKTKPSQLIYDFITTIQRRNYTQNIDTSSLEAYLIRFDKKKWIVKLKKYLESVEEARSANLQIPEVNNYFRENIETIVKYAPEVISDVQPIICRDLEISIFDAQRMLYAYALLDLESKFINLLLHHTESFIRIHTENLSPNVFTALHCGANIKYLKHLRTNGFNIILTHDVVKYIIENGNEETLQYMMDCEQVIVSSRVLDINPSYLKTLKKLRMFHVRAIITGSPTGSKSYQPASRFPKTLDNDNNFIEYTNGLDLTTYELIKMSRSVVFNSKDDCIEYLNIMKSKPMETRIKHGVLLEPYKHSEIWDISTCIFGNYKNDEYIQKFYIDYLLERHPHEQDLKSMLYEVLIFVYFLKIRFVEAYESVHSYERQKSKKYNKPIESLYENIEASVFEQFNNICDSSNKFTKFIKLFYTKDYEKISEKIENSGGKPDTEKQLMGDYLDEITSKVIKIHGFSYHFEKELPSIIPRIRHFQDCLRIREIKIFKNKDYQSLYAHLMSYPTTYYKTLKYMVRRFGVEFIYPYDKWSPDVIQFKYTGRIHNHGRRVPKFSSVLLEYLEPSNILK